MQLNTLRFGEVEIDEEKVITFKQGIPGFESLRSFIMLTPDEELPFSFMQSIEDGDLSFVVANPFVFFPEYDFELAASVEVELGIKNNQDVMVFSIVSINEKDEFSLNLLAPVILNMSTKLGKQVILHSSPYQTKHKIVFTNHTEVNASGEGGASC